MSRNQPPYDPERADAEPVLTVSDLAVSLGGAEILGGVNLSVDAGELVGLVGPNGAGKTTLLRAIRGTLVPDSGGVEIADEDIHGLGSKAASRLVATVPQDTSVSFEFSVRETVEMGRTPHLPRFGGMDEADYDAVERAMARTDVAALADRPVTDISGGERSRVLLARALAQDTPLLLLDEPTASLDLNHQLRTFDTVAELTESGRAALAAIHDLNLAARYCDRLVVVAGGGVLADGPPETILNGETLQNAFDTDAVVTHDPVTERPHVTALSENSRVAMEADGGVEADLNGLTGVDRLHVVAGGGRAGPLLSALGRTDVGTTVGPVAEGDTDAEVARALGLETLELGPLEAADGAVAERTESLAAAADAVVVADVPLSAGIVPVLQAIEDADVPVFCIEERSVSERVGSAEAAERYRTLRDGGTRVTEAELRDALR
ncbi:MAG: ATP-binding cassette domain-containing protein [Halolamina sp.]